MTKQETIVSGIRSTGRLHIGNYLGALKHFVDLQDTANYHGYFFIANLHGITTPFQRHTLTKDTLEVAAEYIAAGLDPKKSTLFIQSQVLEHTALAWILECLTPLGELERMTQYKDKARQHEKNINAGLLSYPVLMAADILLYKPTLVPVGDDQTQHLELTRDLARSFNKKFGQTFPVPKNFLFSPLRIKSLQDPEKKMSKTGDTPIYLDDTPEDIEKKLKKAVTASDGGKQSAGVENLFVILRHFGTKEDIAYFEDGAKTGTIKFSELKAFMAKAIADNFEEFREKKKELLGKPEHLSQILGDGAREARKVASETLLEVKEKIGLL